MAYQDIPSLLPELVQEIALYLPLSDVGKCMQVCKLWKVRDRSSVLGGRTRGWWWWWEGGRGGVVLAFSVS